MATTSSTSWWQQVLMLTSLLANTSDFAALNSSASSTPTMSLTTFLPQYTPPLSVDYGAAILPNIRDPHAIDAQKACPGYRAVDINHSNSTLTAQLKLFGEACNVYGTDVHNLNLTVEYQTEKRLHINISPSFMTPENRSWYVLDEDWVPAPHQEDGTVEIADLIFGWTNLPTFGFNVTREATDEVLFDTIGSKLVFENQFIEFTTTMKDGYNVYGLGEVFRGLRLQPGLTRTIYAADAGDPVDRNIYGSHPFLLETKYYKVDPDTGLTSPVAGQSYNPSDEHISTSHGIYLRNAHGQEVLMRDSQIVWRTLGGEIDLYFFSGPSQPEVTRQYLNAIGLPAMQQYWTFGYHQCRWGYQNWSQTEDVVDAFAKFEIPLETIWNDIDYMKAYRDFENDPIRFSYEDGSEFLQRLHDRGQHYVPIVDAAIYIPNPSNISDAYQVFEEGNKSDVFLLNPDRSLYIGQVWPGYTVFADLLTANVADWWRQMVSAWYDKLKFDGIWIDMSEVSSFCVGSCGSDNLDKNPVHPWFKLATDPGGRSYAYPEGFNITNGTEAAAASSESASQASAYPTSAPKTTKYSHTTPKPGVRDVDHPPYAINHVHGDLAVHAVAPNATHHNGVQEYDVHNLYGHLLLRNTYNALIQTSPGVRPFIIGRSTFVGSGVYAGHWGGDNSAHFRHMYWSIPQALSFSLFGVPMFGVDACGFNGNTDEELCNRWMQLAAFFPFYRNHNTLGAIDQEPYRWSSVITATKIALEIRFQLLPYMYTLFYHAHIHGDTVMRALAWEFPGDPSLVDADRQFFLGPAILVIPVLTQGHTTVDGVFPGLIEGKEVYYDWYNHSTVPIPSSKNTTIEAPLGHIPVYIRGGYILATQQPAMTTRDARQTAWSLIIALDRNNRANGTLYLDDGVSIMPNQTKLATFAAHVTKSGSNEQNYTQLHLDVHVQGTFTGQDLPLANVTVLGLKAPPAFQNMTINNQTHTTFAATYHDANQKLTVTRQGSALMDNAWSQNWTLVM